LKTLKQYINKQMKKTLSTLLSVLFCAITFAQSVPQGINYQAVARDASGEVLSNDTLTIQFSVISDIATSAVSWQETHIVSTNDYGLYTAIIGQGTATSVGSSATFDVIDWGASNHLLKVEVDFGGGIFVDMGTTAFMSVPYALSSGSTVNSFPNGTTAGEMMFWDGVNWVAVAPPSAWLISSNPNNPPSLMFVYGQPDWVYPVLGCTDATAFNYNPSANTDDGSCAAVVYGCIVNTESNYDPLANTHDGSCIGIGDTLQGGIIFWLDGNGGGLIAAPFDQSTGAEWGCYGTNIPGAERTAVGTGYLNTIDIISANCTSSNGSPTAADICANLTLGGYSDWFLPSKREHHELYSNIGQGNALGLGNIAGFGNGPYWSSTESCDPENYANNHYQNCNWKYESLRVRAVRAF
jgi:hypothetical protein